MDGTRDHVTGKTNMFSYMSYMHIYVHICVYMYMASNPCEGRKVKSEEGRGAQRDEQCINMSRV